jgi:hypothetical protein
LCLGYTKMRYGVTITGVAAKNKGGSRHLRPNSIPL